MTARSSLALLVVVALAAGACSAAREAARAPTTAIAESTPPETTTTTTTTTSTTTTTTMPPSNLTGIGDQASLGDSRYPGLGNGGYDVDHYTLDLFFETATGILTGIATIDAGAVADLDAFNLDFVGYEVTTLLVDGQAAPFSRAGRELTIDPAPVLPAGEAFTVTVEYTGTPATNASEAVPFAVGWRTATDGTSYVVAEPDGAATWFPCNDHPLDKATFTFRITAPNPLLAIANGTLTDTITDIGSTTRVYEMAQPMPTYLATVVIGTLAVVEDPTATAEAGVVIRNVLPPDVAAAPPPALGEQGEMLAFLESVFGPYPFDLYGIAVVPEFPGALENSTLSLFGQGFLAQPIFEFVLVHELAHQWFGNHVTPADWGDIWLNEGFATYAEWLWLEHTDGPAALDEITAANREQMASVALPPPGTPPADNLFNASVYRRGGLVLHALRLEIGDAAFFATLRTYVDLYGGATARTTDFIEVAEEVGGRPLDTLFDAWLYGDEVPEL